MLSQLTGEYLLRQLVAPGMQETTVLVVILYRYASAIDSANSIASAHLPDPPPMQLSPAQANALHFLVVFATAAVVVVVLGVTVSCSCAAVSIVVSAIRLQRRPLPY